MSELCARPVCGHEMMAHSPVECWIGPNQCPCPAYRTEAQQKAWEEVETLTHPSLDDVRTDGAFYQWWFRRLLEVNP